MWARFLSDYGMLFVLLALGAVFSAATWSEQSPSGAAGGEAVAHDIIALTPVDAKVLIVVRATEEDQAFAQALGSALEQSGRGVLEVVRGGPADARQALERLARAADKPAVIAATRDRQMGRAPRPRQPFPEPRRNTPPCATQLFLAEFP